MCCAFYVFDKAQDPLPISMSSTSGEADSEFQARLHANGLHAPKDFKLAFTSAQKASEACPVAPETAANAWISISHSEVEVASSWVLWIKSRHDTRKRMSSIPRCTKPTFKIWRGLRNKKARADQGPANDSVQRRAAAKDALHLALSWKERGRLAREWCRLQTARRNAWVEMQTARIAITDASTIPSAIRTWKHWCAWCQAQGEDPLDPTDAAPATFLYAPTQANQALRVPKTAPTTRFNHLRWLETCTGAPVQLAVSDRPAKRAAHEGLLPEQRAASDPEVHIHLDCLLARLHESDPTRIVVAIIRLLWMSVLRFQHMQRSIPPKLTTHFLYGVC